MNELSTNPTGEPSPNFSDDVPDARPADAQDPRMAPGSSPFRRVVRSRAFPWLIVALLLIAYLYATGIIGSSDKVPWLTDLDQAKSQAANADKPMLVLFTAAWCGPCQQLKRNAFADTHTAEFIERHTVPVKIDMTRTTDQNAPIAEAFGVTGFPTMVLADATGQPISRLVGAVSAEQVITWLNNYTNQSP